MARALPPASFVREAPTNHQSVVPVTNDRTLSCPCPSQKRKNFVSRVRSRSAALRGSFRARPERHPGRSPLRQRQRRHSMLARGHSAVLACATPQQPHCPPTHATGREAGPATPATGLRRPFLKTKTQEEPAETRCRRCRSYCVLASSPALGPEPARHPHRGSPQRSWAHAVDELIQQEEEDPVGRLLHSLLPTASALTALTPATLRPTDS